MVRSIAALRSAFPRWEITKMAKTYDKRHGSPYDRGSADAYYRRPYNPHFYTMGTYSSERITNLTPEERDAYDAGYYEETDRKEW